MTEQINEINYIDRMPWLDLRLKEEAINYLWDIINRPAEDAKEKLAGNISKSEFVQDTDNWFYEHVLKECSEYLYFLDWKHYYNVHITKSAPPPVFTLKEMWINYQKQHEFNPCHNHAGIFSFVVFMKIPTHWKDQHALQFSAKSNASCASDFQFLHGSEGRVESVNIPLCPEDEGRILFFPSWLNHQVFPFYECEEERISISGNILSVEFQGLQPDNIEERTKHINKLKVEFQGNSKKPVYKRYLKKT